MGRDAERDLVSLLTRAPDPSGRLHWCDLIIPTKTPPPNTIPLGFRVSTYEFGGTQHPFHSIDYDKVGHRLERGRETTILYYELLYVL